MNTHSHTPQVIKQDRGYWLHLASLLLFGAAFALLATPVHAQDDPPGRIGRIARLSGQAWLYDAEKREWLETGVNQPLTTGDRLSVASDGRAVVQIGSTTVRLDNASELEFKRISDEQISLNLINGGLALQLVAPEVVPEVAILTTEGEFLPRRTGHYRIDRRDGISFAGVWNGELSVNAPGLTQSLFRGQRLELWQEGASGSRSAMHATENDAFSDWVARSQNDAPRSVSQQYLSPEMTGAEDLDRYGRWDEHDDYGPVWYPVVAIGWEPYRHGRWAWVRPWGWTWIDSAPWGFAPFHYGRWISIGGRWAWAPGSRMARPVYAPALVDWPGGVSVNLSIRIGGGPPAGWVPLAPHQHYRPYYRATPVYQQIINRPVVRVPREHMPREHDGTRDGRDNRDGREHLRSAPERESSHRSPTEIRSLPPQNGGERPRAMEAPPAQPATETRPAIAPVPASDANNRRPREDVLRDDRPRRRDEDQRNPRPEQIRAAPAPVERTPSGMPMPAATARELPPAQVSVPNPSPQNSTRGRQARDDDEDRPKRSGGRGREMER